MPALLQLSVPSSPTASHRHPIPHTFLCHPSHLSPAPLYSTHLLLHRIRHRLAAFEMHKGRCPITTVKFNPMGNMLFYAMSYDWSKGAEHNDPKVALIIDMSVGIPQYTVYCHVFIAIYSILLCNHRNSLHKCSKINVLLTEIYCQLFLDFL